MPKTVAVNSAKCLDRTVEEADRDGWHTLESVMAEVDAIIAASEQ